MKLSYVTNGVNILLKPLRSLCLPAHIQIEPINDCNLRCISCPRAKLVDSPGAMALAQYKEIIMATQPKYVTLSGLGETLLHPEIDTMISFCRGKGIYVNLTTNGTLLDAQKASALLDSGLNELSISLDAADRQTYRSIRTVDLWDQLIANLTSFIQLRNQRKQAIPLVRAQFVLQKKNFSQITNFVGLSKELGVDSIYIQHLSLNGIEDRREALVGDLTKESALAALKEAFTYAKRMEMHRTNFAELIRKFDHFWEQYQVHDIGEKRVCINPWFDAYFNVDGRVQPCCAFAGDVSGVYFGNIFSEPFGKLYNNHLYQSFRKKMRKGQRPYDVCRRCRPIGVGDILEQVFFPR